MNTRMILFLLVLVPFSGFAQEMPPSITVRGDATLMRPADQIRFTVGVVSEARTAQEALLENSKKVREVILQLINAGAMREDLETDSFRISPTYSNRPQNASSDWRPTINGYNVSNRVVVKTPQIDQAGQMIDAAVKGGANTVDQVVYELEDPKRYRKEAIEEAASQALRDAEVLAAAAGVRIAGIQSVSLDDTPMTFPKYQASTFALRADSAPPLESKEVAVQASVTVIFLIQQ